VKLNQLTKSRLLNTQLKNTLGYLANGGITPIYEDCTHFKPFFVVVARKHYSITRKSYPALNMTELKALLKINQQQYSDAKPLVEIKPNKEIDGFDVTTIVFDQECAALATGSKVLIPETAILSKQSTAEKQLFELTTPQGVLFFSRSGTTTHSAYCKGLIQNIAAYKHSIGLADDIEPTIISQSAYFRFLAEQFNALAIADLAKISVFNYQHKIKSTQLHALYWGPLISVTLYFAVMAGWQWLSINATKQAIENQADNANQLLSQKQQLDDLNNKVTLLETQVKQNPAVFSDWDIVHSALSTGMLIDKFSSRQGVITLSGESKSANTTIAAIAKLSQVDSAIFKSGVRKYRGSEKFEIEITLHTEVPAGAKANG